MNGYTKDIFYNHVKFFISNELMTANSSRNMNDEKKYSVIIPLIGHPFLIFKKSSSKNLKALIKNVVQYLTHLRFKPTFL